MPKITEITTEYYCSQCGASIDKKEIDKIIDHIYGHSPLNDFRISKEKAEALSKFLYANGYISYEFHPLVHEIIKDLAKYLKGNK